MEKLEQESKYYTTSIEEICVGFECEVYDNGRFQQKYDKCVIEDLNLSSYFYNMLETGFVRTKYLDSQDIIDCGFVLNEVAKHDVIMYNFFTDKLYTPEKIDYIMYELIPLRNGKYFIAKGSYTHKIHPPSGDTPLFIGYIKNKTELKKILQQIGVL